MITYLKSFLDSARILLSTYLKQSRDGIHVCTKIYLRG